MEGNEHAKPGLDEVRRRLLARAAAVGLRGEDDEVIESLLEQELPGVEPTDEECRRYYEQNPRRFSSGDLVEASHILFAVTPRVPPERLRAKAAEVHAIATREPERFASLAREFSNCPSAAQGGALGQLGRGDAVPEFERALFGDRGGDPFAQARLGVLPELVSTRFGFHVVLVARRIPGRVLPYEQARAGVAAFLRERAAERALGEYVRNLAG